ncbi:MAG: M28 family peptidase [Bacteroidota bacterium]
MKKNFLPLLLIFCGLVLGENRLRAADPNFVGLDAMNFITPGRLKAQLTLIASDEFEGRETSFRGQKLAARYLASQFELMGLQPAGDSGTYFQRFPVVHITVDTRSFLTTSTTAGTKEWTAFGKEYIPYSSGRDTTISGEVEFVGYGINSKILQYSDYQSSKNYNGKIVLVLRGAPQEEDSTSPFFKNGAAGSTNAKRIYAERSGAAAVLMVEDLKGRTMEDALEERKDDLVRGLITIPQRIRSGIPMFSVSKNIANELLRSSGKTVDDLQREIDSTERPESFSIKDARVTLTVSMHREEIFSENVIGTLPGSDSLLKNEYVVFSAHYDHLGKNIATGDIYNGADDDGSGTCSLLEIAHAFVSMKQPPKRSLLFLSVSGEEKGLLGSLYYTEHPTIPLEKTITDLNADMIGRFDPDHEKIHDTNYVYVIGSDKLSSELDSISRRANDESMKLNLDYTYDDERDPHQYYRRSDHYNFARKNIPIIFYFNGEHADYHKPTDKVEKINFDILAKRARLIFYTGWKLANNALRPVVDNGGFISTPPRTR